jgi:diguanylate cyclase (GGDEF)-like protein
MNQSAKLLLVDDEENFRFLLKAALKNIGFEVITAKNGIEAIEMLDDVQPNLVLLDLNMPEPDGHEVCKRIKSMPEYMNLPIIILTSSDDLNDKLNSFEEGADDYITKDMDPLEMEKRIQAVLKRYLQNLDSNPLTHLPGNNVIQKAIQKRIENKGSFSVGYCDIDNFKAYNDKYGFVEGDRIILFCANVINDALKKNGNKEDFLGHIGGDDFVFLTTHDRSESICKAIVKRMENEIGQFYSDIDRANGYIISKDRKGAEQKFPLVSISIANVSNEFKPIQSLAEVSKIASELKKAAKSKIGNSYVFDKRIL